MDWSEKCHPLEWYFLFQAGINSDSEWDGGMPKPASQARRCTFDAPHLRLSGLSSTLTGDHTRRCLDSLEGISPATPRPPVISKSGQPRKRRQFSRQFQPFSSLPTLATRQHILAFKTPCPDSMTRLSSVDIFTLINIFSHLQPLAKIQN